MRSIKCVVIWLCLSVCFAGSVQAQTFAEWFRQKKTQQKYLLDQIAALQMYLGYAKKGYQVVGSGLSTIRDITHGEFGLHELFIAGLKKVSPVVRGDVRIAEIVGLQLSIFKAFGSLTGGDGFRGDHLGYVLEVKAGVLLDCLSDLEELYMVVTSGRTEMSDDARLRRLASVHESMLEKSAFTQSFVGSAMLLLDQQKAEEAMLEKFRRYYE